MRFTVLACDYDGTIAREGYVDDKTAWDLGRVRTSGRQLVLVTGRDLPTLRAVCPHLVLFDGVVAENGALLYRPDDGSEQVLADPPPAALAERLRGNDVPVDTGRAVIFTWRPNEVAALEAIAELGLGHQVLLNRQAVMVVPPGVTKGTGLLAALDELRMSAHNTVAVGDAENDHDLIAVAACGVAVGDSVPALAEHADRVTEAAGPDGTRELIAALLDDDLASWGVENRPVPMGQDSAGTDVAWSPAGAALLVTGGSGSGKSTLVSALIEGLAAAQYQVVVVDPEGDFEDLPGAVDVGTPQTAPPVQELADLVEAGVGVTVASLLAVAMDDRPGVTRELLGRLADISGRLGRPHAVVVDEAHHAFPDAAPIDTGALPPGLVLVSNSPRHLQQEVLTGVETVVAVGGAARDLIDEAARAIGTTPPSARADADWDAVAWRIANGRVSSFEPLPARHRRRRHSTKMLTGDVGDGERLVITGPDDSLSLDVRNLSEMVRIAEGVDHSTWSHHRERHDWSRWVRDALDDDDLADAIEEIESTEVDGDAGRRKLREEVALRYPGLESDGPS
jgi:hydroxymethylpyrimidine pyrophosphatase-like HAD family hydrolase/energy-coupling factor transporter ATP-binding protein EcfA2